jgi:mannosyltransferase
MNVVSPPVDSEPAEAREDDADASSSSHVAYPLVWLGALVLGAAFLRFRGLSTQSFWFDESVTVTLVRRSFVDMINQLPASESTPPLYYALAWPWTQLFGSGEAGIRSLSAVLGVATVLVVYLAARQLFDSRAALFAAAIVAFNPMLIWYSQEARAYALLALLAAIGFWLAARIVTDGATRRLLWWWAGVSIAAMLTHYFAVFIVLAEGVWLYRTLEAHRDVFKRAVIAMLVLCTFVLAPLAMHGERDGRTAWIAKAPVGERLGEVQKELLTASTNIVSANSKLPDNKLWPPLAFIAVATGLVVALRTTDPRYRLAARAALAVAAGALAVPLLLSGFGIDFFKDRNLIAVWVPWFIAIAAGLACIRRAWIGVAAVAVIAAGGIAITNDVYERPFLQRSDWRAAIHAIKPGSETTLLALEPAYSQAPLQVYGLEIHRIQPGTQRATRFTALGMLAADDARWPQRFGAFRRQNRAQYGEIGSVTYVADKPTAIDKQTLQRLQIRDTRSLLTMTSTR